MVWQAGACFVQCACASDRPHNDEIKRELCDNANYEQFLVRQGLCKQKPGLTIVRRPPYFLRYHTVDHATEICSS